MLKKRLFLAGILAALSTQTVSGQTFTVSNNSDTGAGSLRQAITDANLFNGAATINFSITNSTVNLGSMLPILSNPNGITINGGTGNIINGGSTSNTTGDRVFFIGVPANTPAAAGGFLPSTAATNWNINNLTIQNGNARGGNGSGGGAGLGGGIFLNAGNLTLSNVNFANNRAIGGNGGSAEGGGGMGGSGGAGGGGFGLGANGGGGNTAGSPGIFTNGSSGGAGPSSTYSGGVNGGGGGGYVTGSFLVIPGGGGGGVGGGSGDGGIGGFGGGGGEGGTANGGQGGFGGGGGKGRNAASVVPSGNGGAGGFGGGGGGGGIGNAFQLSGAGGVGGFGAGSGTVNNGGGGLGAGGAIFVRQGSTLTIQDGGISGGTVTGGIGFQNGQAIGSGIFLAGSVNYSVTSGAVTINDTLGGGVNAQITGGFTKSGAGTLVLGGTNSYTGNTNINAGVLSVSSNANLGNTSNDLIINTGTLQAAGTFNTARDTSINAANSTIDVTASNTLTHSGIISGSGILSKSGTGTLVLSGNNNYTGRTIITAGTIQVSSNANLGDTSSPGITLNGGTLQVDNSFATARGTVVNFAGGTIDVTSSNTLTHSGILSASGALTKSGMGTLILAGTNTYSGGTRIDQGIVSIGADANLGNSSGGLTFDGGTLQASSTFTTARGTTLNAAGGSIEVNASTTLTHSGVISGVGGLIKLGAGTLTLTGANTYTGGTTLAGTAGSTVILGNASALGAATNSLTLNAGNTLDVNGLFAGVNVGALTGTGTITNNPSTNAGGTLRVGNGDVSSTFAGTLQDGAVNKPLTLLKVGTGTLTLTGNNSHNTTQVDAGTLSVQQASNLGQSVNLQQGGILQWAGSNATYTGRISLNAFGGSIIEVTNSATTITQVGSVNGSGNLTKSGPGTLDLSNNNNNGYQGGTTLAAGTLSVAASQNLGVAGTMLTFNGGTLQITGTSFTINTRPITWGINGGGFDIANAANTFTVSQNLGAGGSLTKLGAGTLVLSGNNSYTGGTNLNAGVLRVSSDANLGNSSGGLSFDGGTLNTTSSFTTNRGTTLNATGGSLDVNTGTTLTHSGIISGTGGLTKLGAGTLVLSSNNTYTGGTTINAGTLQVGDGGTTGSLGTGLATINAGATLSYLRSDVFTLGASFAGSGTLNFLGTGGASQSSYSLSGSNSAFAGSMNIGSAAAGNGARVAVSSQARLGTASVTVNDNSQIYLQTGTYSNNFTINGTGWTGGLGALRMDGGSTITGSVTLAGNSRIGVGNAGTIAGVISGNAALEKVQAGTLTLSGNNTYTGSTLVAAGTLLINGDQSAATGEFTVASGATLGGTGTVGRTVTFSGGTLSPGAPNNTGILTIKGGVTLNPGSIFRVELQGSVAGSGYDQLLLQPDNPFSTFVISPTSTQLVGDRLGSYQANFLDSFVILRNIGNTNPGVGNFSGLADGAFFDFDGQVFQIRYNVPTNYIVDPTGTQTGFAGITWAGDDGFGNYGSDNGGNIVIAAVPEPGTWALILSTLSIYGYMAARRMKRKEAVENIEIE